MALDFFAGCVGGCAGVAVGHPLDTVKVRLQTQDPTSPRYSGTMHCLRSTIAKEGVRGIYRGISSPLAGIAGINAIVFGAYGNTQRMMKDPDSIRTITIAGCVAGLCQSIIGSPIELAKSRMQIDTSQKSPIECIRNIYKNNGTRGVFKGLGITTARDVPAFASYFFTYEVLTRRQDGQSTTTAMMLMAGGLAGVVSWTIPYPIDVIKTRLQVDTVNKYSGAFDCFKHSVRAEGIGCLYRGLTPTLIRAFPVNAVTFTVVNWTIKLFNEEAIFMEKASKNADVLLLRFAEAIYFFSGIERDFLYAM